MNYVFNILSISEITYFFSYVKSTFSCMWSLQETNEYRGWLFPSARDKIYHPQLSTLFLLIIYAI